MLDVFNQLEKWSELQQRVCKAFVENDATVVSVPNRCGASSVLAGLAVAQAVSGRRVLILEPTYLKYAEMVEMLKRYAQKYTSDFAFAENGMKFYFYDGTVECIFQDTCQLPFTNDIWHCILVDNAQDTGAALFFKGIVPVMQCHDVKFMAIGRGERADENNLLRQLQRLPSEFICQLQIVEPFPHWAHWLNKAKAKAMKSK